MKKGSRFYYNLVEITLAMAVVGIGIAGIMALFVPALDSSRESVAENYSSQVATTLLSYIQRFKRSNWTSTSHTWFTVGSEPAVPAVLPFKNGNPDTAAWRSESGSSTNEVLPGVFALASSHGAGVYGLTLGSDIESPPGSGTYIPDGRKFCGFARVWQENLSSGSAHNALYSETGDTNMGTVVNTVINNHIVRFYVEISYPATVPAANRKTSLYIFEVGRPQ